LGDRRRSCFGQVKDQGRDEGALAALGLEKIDARIEIYPLGGRMEDDTAIEGLYS
jgi:hypothetical protein